MPRKNDNPEFRLRPGKPRVARERHSSPGFSVAFLAVLKYARISRAGQRQQGARAGSPQLQHCAVRVTYSGSRVAGNWGAHGRYIARESASLEPERAGFGADANAVDIVSKLRDWQEAADPRLWMLILSPEFGEHLDLERLTRDVMSRMESDLHTSLEWVAVSHFNTEHPHVHIALRGIDSKGEEFRLDREYIKSGLRSVAQHFATVQIGYRTEQDATLAIGRQVPLQRFTPLDRLILARTQPPDGISGDFRVEPDPARPNMTRFAAVREQALASRLRTLETIGLARADGPHRIQPVSRTARYPGVVGGRQSNSAVRFASQAWRRA